MDGYPTVERETASAPEWSLTGHDSIAAHDAWVRAVARNLVRDPWSAEDVAQETLLAALSTPPPDVPDEQRLRAWLGRVAFNLSRLGARQGARRHAREARVARREALPSVSDELEAAGTMQALTQALAQLPAPYQAVVRMRYFDGLSTAEIARRTQTTELAIRKRLWRARNKLRDVLDHDPRGGRLLAALLPFIPRVLRVPAVAAAAAGVALVAGVGWLQEDSAPTPRLARLTPAPGLVPPSSSAEGGAHDPEGSRSTSRRPDELRGRRELRGTGNVPPTTPPDEEPVPEPLPLGRGVVLDLEAHPVAGVDLVAVGRSERVLATSDALGAFELPLEEKGLSLEVRAEGLATLVAARLERATAAEEQPLVVAQAADLEGSVRDQDGRPVAEPLFELWAEEQAFARLDRPVHLDSGRLASFRGDTQGVFQQASLPRGEGLVLRVHAAGFESVELATSALGGRTVVVLRALAAGPELTGIVRYPDGWPARDASVHLAYASTTTDSLGRFRLPLLGVRADSALEAESPEKSADPAHFKRFGAVLLAGFDEPLEIELGEKRDPVAGKLLGDEGGGWLVAAFRTGGLAPEAVGDELAFEPPSAVTRSRPDGRFELLLPEGEYDLYAVGPHAPRVGQRSGLSTHSGSWDMAVPDAAPLSALQGEVRSAAATPLASADVTVAVRLDGAEGRRVLDWRTFTTDEAGLVEIPRSAGTPLEVRVSHPALGRAGFSVALPPAAESLRVSVPAPTFVQVADAGEHLCRGTVLDAEGRVLHSQGPLEDSVAFRVHEGWSPVLEVPSSARWLELGGDEGEPLRLPIEPLAGRVLRVRP